MDNPIINGSDLLIYVTSGTTKIPVAYATSVKIERTMKTRDTSNKTDGEYGSKAPGKKEWTASADCNFSFTENYYSHKKLIENYNSSTLLTLSWGLKTSSSNNQLATTGNFVESGDAYITSISESAGYGDNATFSVSFEGVGGISTVA